MAYLNGTEVRRRRKLLNITQTDIAKQLGCHCTSVTRWETNRSHIGGKNLHKMANILKCKVDDIIKPEYVELPNDNTTESTGYIQEVGLTKEDPIAVVKNYTPNLTQYSYKLKPDALKRLRHNHHISAMDLSKSIGCGKNQVCKWESGKVGIKAVNLEKLAKALGCKASDIAIVNANDKFCETINAAEDIYDKIVDECITAAEAEVYNKIINEHVTITDKTAEKEIKEENTNVENETNNIDNQTTSEFKLSNIEDPTASLRDFALQAVLTLEKHENEILSLKQRVSDLVVALQKSTKNLPANNVDDTNNVDVDIPASNNKQSLSVKEFVELTGLLGRLGVTRITLQKENATLKLK